MKEEEERALRFVENNTEMKKVAGGSFTASLVSYGDNGPINPPDKYLIDLGNVEDIVAIVMVDRSTTPATLHLACTAKRNFTWNCEQ